MLMEFVEGVSQDIELVGNAWLTFLDKSSVPHLCAEFTAYQVSMSLARTVQITDTFAALPVYTAAKQ
jgi:hypothetical protein